MEIIVDIISSVKRKDHLYVIPMGVYNYSDRGIEETCTCTDLTHLSYGE